MPNAQFTLELKSWIDTFPTWKKNLSLDILARGTCRKEAMVEALDAFLIENKLKKAPEPTSGAATATIVPATSGVAVSPVSDSAPLILSSIQGFKSVSALRDGERIEVGPGLTVIYGVNGAGKSSYVRMLNRAFSSRGDQEILQNVFAEPTGDPSCEFCFNADGTAETVSFPAQKEHPYLQRFSVFDGKSARVHLDQKNELLFVPGGFEFFTSLNDGLDGMVRLMRERTATRKPVNPLAHTFERMSPVWKIVNGISAGTTMQEIKEQAVVADASVIEHLAELELELAKLKTSEVAADVKKLNSLSANLDRLVTALQKINEQFSLTNVTKLLRARTQVQKKDQEARQTGTARFTELGIKYAGTPQFKTFLESAAAFMELRDEENDCPYCDRPLQERGKVLKTAYEGFLSSTAEKESATARRALDAGIEVLEAIHFPQLDDSQTLFTQMQRDEAGKKLAVTYVHQIKAATEFRDVLLERLRGNFLLGEPSVFIIDHALINDYQQAIAAEVEQLKKLDPATEIVKKEAEVSLLRDRIKLGEELDGILDYLKALQWCDRAGKLITSFATNSVTIKQREFFNKYVTDDYLKTFEAECKKLDAQLKVEISQQGTKGKTIRDLKVGGVDPGRVLSEGEQRATALADFLTEIQVSGNCCGLVFDDPVTSLDHERKKLIAKRAVEEACNRQVVVFTHDLVFASYLKSEAEAVESEYVSHWVVKDENGPGRVWLKNGPTNAADYKKSTIPKKWLEKCKNASPTEQEYALKEGFGALRTCYESFVIHGLFRGSVLRFDERISVGRLTELVFDDEIINQVIEKSGELSRYIEGHLHSDKYVEIKPTPEILKSEIELFDAMNKRQRELVNASKN